MLSVVENAGLRWYPRMLMVGASAREPTGSCTRMSLVMEVTTRHPVKAPWGSQWMQTDVDISSCRVDVAPPFHRPDLVSYRTPV
eukprot:363869-Chlamydomonas_euryale.AAC.17